MTKEIKKLPSKEKTISKADATEMLEPLLNEYINKIENNKINEEEFQKTFEKIEGYLTEDAENKLLKAKLKKTLKEEEFDSWENFKKELEKNN